MRYTDNQVWQLTNDYFSDIVSVSAINLSAVTFDETNNTIQTGQVKAEYPFSAGTNYNPFIYYYTTGLSATANHIKILNYKLLQNIFDAVATSAGFASDVYNVANVSAMLNLSGVKKSDVVNVSATQTFINLSGTNGSMSNWSQIYTSGQEDLQVYQVSAVEDMLTISNPRQSEIAIIALSAQSYINISGTNGSIGDWAEIVTNGLTPSDIRLKINIKDIPECLEKINNLRPVYYNWVEVKKRGAQKEIGLIAQEVQEIIPEIVRTNYDGILSLDYPKLTAILIGSIKELTERIELLESKLNQKL